MKRAGLTLMASLLLLCGAGNAQGAVVAIGPFTGDISETWEGFNNYSVGNPNFYLNSPERIFGNNASISNSVMAVYDPASASFGLANSGSAQVSDGIQGMGLDSSAETATIEFDNPVSSFGAFWGAATLGSPATVTVSFFDEFGQLIDTVNFAYDHEATADGVLDWHGWSSTTPIKSVSYSGFFVVNDGLQANVSQAVIPEPSSLTLLGFTGLAAAGYFGGRRRKTALA